MWIWKIEKGECWHDDKLIARGYAGRGIDKNNPNSQAKVGLGPLPIGKYKIGLPYNHPDLGPICMNLLPDPKNDMHGRSAFRIHGDSKKNPGEASHGCIVLGFLIRGWIADSSDKNLEVII